MHSQAGIVIALEVSLRPKTIVAQSHAPHEAHSLPPPHLSLRPLQQHCWSCTAIRCTCKLLFIRATFLFDIGVLHDIELFLELFVFPSIELFRYSFGYGVLSDLSSDQPPSCATPSDILRECFDCASCLQCNHSVNGHASDNLPRIAARSL
ncbi:hypothetical protein SISSUDRAFT_67702 [Sistotremastrum suecicum HHB10207 ss-3]|uniref:Uncharacterized protein n=1 Tax=Sistotremastrum suecicum HHB10207 ss-3 TaxID=1314776 RepID=A0A166BHV5_9AGAM|nr:hypothetical protein SISSUDRAFT_67702 [Sistotremastrum suecicum HHB10207 ss-3]